MYGPFFIERAIVYHLDLRRFTINESELFFRLVFLPLDKTPQGEHGCRPPELLPSPPPIGWSTGFIELADVFGHNLLRAFILKYFWPAFTKRFVL